MELVKLANIVIDSAGFLSASTRLSFIPEGKSWGKYDALHDCLTLSGSLNFSTYFNALSVRKWESYCAVRSARLHLELKGDACRIEVISYVTKNGHGLPLVMKSKEVEASNDYRAVEVDFTFGSSVLMGFRIVCQGVCSLAHSYYYTLVDEKRIRSVNVALSMTTFRHDVASLANIRSIKELVFDAHENFASHMRLILVDQRSPEGAVGKKDLAKLALASGLPESSLKVVSVPEIGPSGFMAVSMAEAVNPEGGFTHLVAVGPNYKIHPECLLRMYTMLTLLTPEHVLSCICGGTFRANEPSVQLGDSRFVSKYLGEIRPVKTPFDLSSISSVVLNEEEDPGAEGAYVPWRLSCLPVAMIKDQGFPLPFHVYCDDVEYGLRSKPDIMTMSGIGCWDAGRSSRLGEETICYQFVRNMLVTNAVHDFFDERFFMFRYWRSLRIFLRYFDYASAELWLDGLEDYLKGPRFLKGVNGAKVLRDNTCKDSRLVPLSELPVDIRKNLQVKREWLQDAESPHVARRLVETLPHDPHFLPDVLLRTAPGVVGLRGNATPWLRTAFCKTLVALDESATMAEVRVMDRARFRKLQERASDLRVRFASSNRAVALLYQEEFRSMSSGDFWEIHLANLRKDENAAQID